VLCWRPSYALNQNPNKLWRDEPQLAQMQTLLLTFPIHWTSSSNYSGIKFLPFCSNFTFKVLVAEGMWQSWFLSFEALICYTNNCVIHCVLKNSFLECLICIYSVWQLWNSLNHINNITVHRFIEIVNVNQSVFVLTKKVLEREIN